MKFCLGIRFSCVTLVLIVSAGTTRSSGEQPDERAQRQSHFVQAVQPIFETHCIRCHGQAKQSSGLRLDVKQAAFQGGDGYGPSIIPGDPAGSPLVELVTSPSPEHRMPPEGNGLSAEEIKTIVQWISGGAEWPDGVDGIELDDPQDHWSFQPLREDFDHASIDEFVAAKLLENGLQFSEEASALVWLRRVTHDLTGLPPTPTEVDAFLNQIQNGVTGVNEGTKSEGFEREIAYRAVVDRLLQSERYGEHWGQHWLDVVRYADTHGFEVNTERPNAWPYRDYVIKAFNDDTPYDQFIREQIVGDSLGQDAATGFLVTASVLLPGQIGKDAASIRLARQDALDEIVNNVSQTFLGLSVSCARCHNHKFDPITARDYYSMQALVAGVEYEDRELTNPDLEIQGLLAKQSSPGPASTLNGVSSESAQKAEQLLTEKSQLEQEPKPVSAGQLVFAGKFRQPDPIYLLLRGDPEQPREEVEPAVLSSLGTARLGHRAPESERRQLLADWIADANNPLTSRVMVNRIWQWHFGRGIVATPSDFGRSGVRPTHPELLDWLAKSFIESGWSVKKLHRQIVLSQTYRQSSRIDTRASKVDADARWLWRYPSRRREAESLRDSMLYVCGKLDTKMFGPGYDLFNQRGGLSGFLPVESLNAENCRRMIYAHKVRRESEVVFGAFDCPDAGQSTSVRSESTTPIQALNLLNSRFTLECAQFFAARVANEVGPDSHRQIERAYQLALNRLPTPVECQEAANVVEEHGLEVLCRALFNCNEFLFIP